MVNYVCERCLTKFNHKGNYTRHVAKTYKCEMVVPLPVINYQTVAQELREEINLLKREKEEMMKKHEEEINSFKFEREKMVDQHEKEMNLFKRTKDEMTKQHEEEMNSVENNKQHIIDKCDKEITQMRTEHEEEVTQIKIKYEAQVSILDREKDKRQKILNLANFGNESYQDIIDKDVNYFSTDISKCICDIIKHVHFNNKLEYRNIYIDDKKDRLFIRKFDTVIKNWVVKEQRPLLKKLIRDVICDIEELSKETLCESSQELVIELINSYNKNKKLQKETYEKVRDIVINGSFDGDTLFWIYQEKYII